MTASVNLYIDKGMTFRKTFRYLDSLTAPISLAGYTAKMQIRVEPDALEHVLELTSSNGGITLGTDGTISIFINSAQTDTFNFRDAVYDLILTASNGDKIRLVDGSITVSATVTR